MGYIKEPEGVDFIIKSEPLTDEDREQISKFIQEYKRKQRNKRGESSFRSKEKSRISKKVQSSSE